MLVSERGAIRATAQCADRANCGLERLRRTALLRRSGLARARARESSVPTPTPSSPASWRRYSRQTGRRRRDSLQSTHITSPEMTCDLAFLLNAVRTWWRLMTADDLTRQLSSASDLTEYEYCLRIEQYKQWPER